MLARIRNLIIAFITAISCIISLLLYSKLLSADNIIGAPIQYDTAVAKAQEAAYIQTGVKADVDLVGHWAENWGNKHIVEQSPAIAACIGVYWVYRNRSVKIPLGGGKKLTIYTDKAEFVLPIY